MARSTRTVIRSTGGGEEKTLREEFNKVVDELDNLKTQFAALLTKLDANHAAATDHVATLACSAASAKKVGVK